MVDLRKRLSAIALLAMLGISTALTGCDPADTGAFELPIEGVRFTYTVQGNEMAPGSLTNVTANAAVDIRNIVERHNFTMADVVAVRVTSRRRGPELEIRQPLTAGVNHIAQVNVRGMAGSSPGPIIVRGSGFTGTTDRAPLETQNANLTDLAAGGALTTRLEIEPTQQAINALYQIDVTFDIIIEVEG